MSSIVRKYQNKTTSPESIKIMVPSIDAFQRELSVPNGIECEQRPKGIEEHLVSVGILHGEMIQFAFDTDFLCKQSDKIYHQGDYCLEKKDGVIYFDGAEYEELYFMPIQPTEFYKPEGAFVLKNVMIGVDFHWQRYEMQAFKGDLKFILDGEHVYAINVIDVEAYLFSVISSEMSSTASLELLKAHAVMSRSWLLASMGYHDKSKVLPYEQERAGDGVHIKWYERDAHDLFDVCADDHCQRYQGISRVKSEKPLQAILETRAEVLMYDNKICDARYSKSCGGVSELFENCWAEEHHNYLEAVPCACNGVLPSDLSIEENAQSWIRSGEHSSFCNTQDKDILAQVLNNYDQETVDFYRWKEVYTQDEISELLKQRSGIDFGKITDIIPIKRGASGRIIKLKIVGTNRTIIVGKELEIRKWLSTSHLYSSAFVVDKAENTFTFIGAGWGHGVGLCQIGAAVMGSKGYDYKQILAHYFRGAKIALSY